MNMTKIGWDEIVFENRNKDYGAYLLRHNYPYNLSVSALIVIILFLSIMLCPRLFKGEHKLNVSKKVTIINYSRLAPPPPIEKIYVPPKATLVVKEQIQKYIAPKVVQEEVIEEEEMPTIEEVRKTIDIPTDAEVQGVEGGEAEVIAPPYVEEVIQAKPPEPDPTVKQPEFPGGEKALARWIENHLKYPSVATRMGIQGVVIVEFSVDVKGRISDASVVQSLHRACDTEALRLVNSMPAWTPGEASGKKVTIKRKLPIPFVLE
jgi:periplasmic protein TonB